MRMQAVADIVIAQDRIFSKGKLSEHISCTVYNSPASEASPQTNGCMRRRLRKR